MRIKMDKKKSYEVMMATVVTCGGTIGEREL